MVKRLYLEDAGYVNSRTGSYDDYSGEYYHIKQSRSEVANEVVDLLETEIMDYISSLPESFGVTKYESEDDILQEPSIKEVSSYDETRIDLCFQFRMVKKSGSFKNDLEMKLYEIIKKIRDKFGDCIWRPVAYVDCNRMPTYYSERTGLKWDCSGCVKIAIHSEDNIDDFPTSMDEPKNSIGMNRMESIRRHRRYRR